MSVDKRVGKCVRFGNGTQAMVVSRHPDNPASFLMQSADGTTWECDALSVWEACTITPVEFAATGSIASRLKEWRDFDVTMHAIGMALGLMTDAFAKYKWVFWTDNVFGNMLGGVLKYMVDVGQIEHDEAADQYRWNAAYDEIRRRNMGIEEG